MTEGFVYILRCADDTLYTGITNNLIGRCKQHDDGKASRYPNDAFQDLARSESA